MIRKGDIVYDAQGHEVARRIKGWWYTFHQNDGRPEYAPLDPEPNAAMEATPCSS